MGTIFRLGSTKATATGDSISIGDNRFAQITTKSLTTAAGASYTLTVSGQGFIADDIAFASVRNGSNTAGAPRIGTVTMKAGEVEIEIVNAHAEDALAGTLVVSLAVFGK